MPIYEYECSACGGRFEVTRKFSDPELTACALCGKETVRKVLSPTAFVLKGSGWYATDYAAKGRSSEETPAKAKEEAKSKTACTAGACAGSCPSKD